MNSEFINITNISFKFGSSKLSFFYLYSVAGCDATRPLEDKDSLLWTAKKSKLKKM